MLSSSPVPSDRSFRQRLTKLLGFVRSHFLLKVGSALICSVIALELSELTGRYTDTPVFVYFVLAAALCAWLLDSFAGILTLTIGFVEAAYFLMEPIHSLRVASPGQLIRMGAHGVVAILILYALSRLKAAEEDLRQQAAERRRADERQLFAGAIVDSSDDAIIGKNMDGIIKTWNRGAEHLYGYSAEEAIGKPISILLPSGQEDDLTRIMEHISGGEAIHHYETDRRRKDGSTVKVQLTISPIRSRTGEITGASTAARDVSRLLDAERNLRQRERVLESVLDLLPIGVFIADKNGRITTTNRAAEEIWGKNQPKVSSYDEYGIYRGWFVDNGQRVKPADWAMSRALSSGERVLNQELAIENFDGQQKFILNGAVPLHGDHGEVTGAVAVNVDITNYKQAENALRESKERLRLFIEHAPAAIAMLDRDFRYVAASRRWIDDFGLTGHIEGLSHYELFPEIPERWKQIHQRALHGEVLSADDDLFERQDGSVQWIKWEVRPWRTAGGDIGGILVASEDVSSRVRIQDALRRSEARLSTALDHLIEGVIISTLGGEICYWNAAGRAMHGFATSLESQIPLKSFPDLFELWEPDGSAIVPFEQWPMLRIMQGETVRNLELRLRRRGQDWERIVLYSGEQIETGGGERLVYLSIYDLTAQRKAEQALRESEEKFRTLAENVPQMIWVVDEATNVLYLAPKWSEYTGTSPEENAHGGWVNIIHPDDRTRSVEAWKTAIARQCTYETEYRIRRHDGEYRWHLARAVPILDRNRRIIWFGTSTDIEDQKRAQKALIRSEKLASVGRMAATVAHEVNNPLAIITNSVYIALMDSHLSLQSRKSLETAEQELKRVAHLTRQTLGFYRESTSPADVDLGTVVDEVVELYAPRFMQRGITIRSEHRDQTRVQAIAGEIRQVVSNIVANAIDACERGGIVRVRTRKTLVDGRHFVRMTFADNGEGIARNHLKHIFEPFFTTKQAFGTGLGLWVSNEIVRRHQGMLQVKSRRGKGTVFSVLLPENGIDRSTTTSEGVGDWQRAS